MGVSNELAFFSQPSHITAPPTESTPPRGIAAYGPAKSLHNNGDAPVNIDVVERKLVGVGRGLAKASQRSGEWLSHAKESLATGAVKLGQKALHTVASADFGQLLESIVDAPGDVMGVDTLALQNLKNNGDTYIWQLNEEVSASVKNSAISSTKGAIKATQELIASYRNGQYGLTVNLELLMKLGLSSKITGLASLGIAGGVVFKGAVDFKFKTQEDLINTVHYIKEFFANHLLPNKDREKEALDRYLLNQISSIEIGVGAYYQAQAGNDFLKSVQAKGMVFGNASESYRMMFNKGNPTGKIVKRFKFNMEQSFAASITKVNQQLKSGKNQVIQNYTGVSGARILTYTHDEEISFTPDEIRSGHFVSDLPSKEGVIKAPVFTQTSYFAPSSKSKGTQTRVTLKNGLSAAEITEFLAQAAFLGMPQNSPLMEGASTTQSFDGEAKIFTLKREFNAGKLRGIGVNGEVEVNRFTLSLNFEAPAPIRPVPIRQSLHP